uniref:uncharacterized protein LOC131139802 n=1 Tax=Doryrhamphus excisus TaxID=161450 RepID=UPI0025AE033C|nr:uncharacterized protein LOC131139802 [Doryrhamphus excisus]
MYATKMRIPLPLGIYLGLWATVNSMLVNSVTQIPMNAAEDVFREAVTDGFLVEQFFGPSDQSESLQENTTTRQSDQTSSGADESHNGTLLENASEGSASGDNSDGQFQPSTTFTGAKEGKDAPADEDVGSGGDIGSGQEDVKVNLKTKRIIDFPSIQGDKPHHLLESESPEAPQEHKGHVTPDWIIIVGFIVGVAALVMLCAAIATRDKWNGPNQASQTQTGSTKQQKEAETETFLQKDGPRENGKAEEYTVIPLDELPEKYSQ